MSETQAEQRFTDAELVERVDQCLRQQIDEGGAQSLREAMAYSVFGGGKRIRPLLCIRACEAVGGSVEQSLQAASAIELIHTFSLVHDDLPAMDDDDLRRGRPTLHKHTSEAMAVLAGDAMMAVAFEMVADSPEHVRWLSSMTKSMIDGQVHDTMGDFPEKATPEEKLHLIHRQKTGALIHAAVQMGAIDGGASEQQRVALTRYAGAIGIMFQAVDDLLDVTQSTEKMGKATGKDAEAGKLTYPSLLGIDGTRVEIEKLRVQAIEALSGFDHKAEPLRDLAQRLAERDR